MVWFRDVSAEIRWGGKVDIFINMDRNRIKLLHWENGGFVLYYKRLESVTLELLDMDEETKNIKLYFSPVLPDTLFGHGKYPTLEKY